MTNIHPVASRMADVMVRRLAADLATTDQDLRRAGFTRAAIEAHGTAAIAQATKLAQASGLQCNFTRH